VLPDGVAGCAPPRARENGAAACAPQPSYEAWTTICTITERPPMRAACRRDESGCRTAPSDLAPRDTYCFGPGAQPGSANGYSPKTGTDAGNGLRGASGTPPYAWLESDVGKDGQGAASPLAGQPEVDLFLANKSAAAVPPYGWVEGADASLAGAPVAVHRTPRSNGPASRAPPYEWREDAAYGVDVRQAVGRSATEQSACERNSAERGIAERGEGCYPSGAGYRYRGAAGSLSGSGYGEASDLGGAGYSANAGGCLSGAGYSANAGGCLSGVGYAGASIEPMHRGGKRHFGPVYTPPSARAAASAESRNSMRPNGCAESSAQGSASYLASRQPTDIGARARPSTESRNSLHPNGCAESHAQGVAYNQGNASAQSNGCAYAGRSPSGIIGLRARLSIPPAPTPSHPASTEHQRVPAWGGPGERPLPLSSRLSESRPLHAWASPTWGGPGERHFPPSSPRISPLRQCAPLPTWGGPGEKPFPPSSRPPVSRLPARRTRVLRLAGGPPPSPASSGGGGGCGQSSLDAQLGGESCGNTPAH
jgi:hypothetical protein